jgi:hypothetical protein
MEIPMMIIIIIIMLQTARCLKTEIQREITKIRHSRQNKSKKVKEDDAWGLLPQNLDEKQLDIEQSHLWLKS